MDATIPDAPALAFSSDPRSLPRDHLARAVWRRDESRSEADRVRRRAEGRPELSKWAALADALARDAERSLVLAILATAPEFEASDVGSGAQQDRWAAVGVRVGGTFYLAIPHPDRDDDDGGDGTDLMRLATVEAGRLLDPEGTDARAGRELASIDVAGLSGLVSPDLLPHPRAAELIGRAVAAIGRASAILAGAA